MSSSSALFYCPSSSYNHPAVELYQEKADKAGLFWDKALNELSGMSHKWRWDYMDYLEDIKYKDTAELTLEEANKRF